MTHVLIPREAWTTTPRPVGKLTRLDPAAVRGIAVHWPGSPGTWGAFPAQATSARRLEAERAQHTSPSPSDPSKPWTDLAYSLAVDLAGRVFDGRGIDYRPAANGDRVVNSRYIAVTVLMGTDDEVTPAAVEGVRFARSLVLDRYPDAVEVVGHRDVHQTECPGDRLYQLVRSGAFLAPSTEREADVPQTQDERNALSAEVWGPDSSYVIPIADSQYADRTLPDGRPVIAPITALRWAVEGIQTLRSEVALLRAELAASGMTPVDPAAFAAAVRADLAQHLTQ